MKIITIVGARPQFIKAAALSRAIIENGSISEIVVHTGQHYDFNMSAIFFEEMEIPKPHYQLHLGGTSHGAMTGRMLEEIEKILMKEQSSLVVVFGDTNSTLAGALAAAKLHIPLAHIEAGLRSFNRQMPEEINRILTDHCADLLFTPCQKATLNLKKEGIPSDKIHQVGDIMYDSLLYYQRKAETISRILDSLKLEKKGYALATIHRAENCDKEERFKEIFLSLNDIADHLPVILPLHPRAKKSLENFQMQNNLNKHLIIVEPLGYFDMITLEKHAKIIFTDSGGVQKEAFFLNVPCITLRDDTEWMELVEEGFNRLVSAKRGNILHAYKKMIEEVHHWDKQFFGNGNSAKLIVDLFTHYH